MSIQSQSVHLLLTFDQAISWPDTQRVTSEALAFFHSRFDFDRSSIALIDGSRKNLSLFTLDNSIEEVSTSDSLSLNRTMQKNFFQEKEPLYQTDLIKKRDGNALEKKLSLAGIQSYFSIPLVLDEVYRQGRIKPGDLLLLSGFGAGLTWGTVLLQW